MNTNAEKGKMYILWTRLKSIELIIDTAKFTNADVKYWFKERKKALKDILKYQLSTFDT